MSTKDWIPTIESETKRLKEMMKSCFAYHSLSKTNNYIAKYEAKLGTKLFNEIYDSYEIELNNKYTVKSDVYTDGEGCSYNSLIEN
jgi:hypothetical protein